MTQSEEILVKSLRKQVRLLRMGVNKLAGALLLLLQDEGLQRANADVEALIEDARLDLDRVEVEGMDGSHSAVAVEGAELVGKEIEKEGGA